MSVDSVLLARLPAIAKDLFAAKAEKNLTFESIGAKLGKHEIWVASVFYGQAKPEESDIKALAALLDIEETTLTTALGPQYFPDKGKLIDLPPRDPLLYRLYEIVQNFGYAYKAIIHEKFGDVRPFPSFPLSHDYSGSWWIG